MVARFRVETFARIDAALEDGEDRAAFVRGAVEHEIKRRSQAKASSPTRLARRQSHRAADGAA
jgi:hypothetical protein